MNKESRKHLEQYKIELKTDFNLTKMKPIQISLWNGYVMGSGVGISINSKIRIATDNTVFSMPETAIGLFPDVGASYFLTRIFNNSPSIGLYVGLTGMKIKGKESTLYGVSTHYVKKENIEPLKNEIIEKINDSTDLNILLNIIESFSEIIYSQDKFSFPNQKLIEEIFIMDSIQNIFSRLEAYAAKGSDENEAHFAKETLDTLNKMSPISLVVFLELCKRSMNFSSIEQAYELEYNTYIK
jgi:3-hydroxyisobutyryl-CoA hydrolase